MTSRFDSATELVERSDLEYVAQIGDEWSIAGVPNGGLLMSITAKAAIGSVGAPDPLSMTTHFLSPTAPGSIDVLVEVVKQGRTFSTAVVRVNQGDRERSRTLITLGDLSKARGQTLVRVEPPLPTESWAEFGGTPLGPLNVVDEFEYQMQAQSAWNSDSPTNVPEVEGRIRFVDGRQPDLVALPLMLDAFPPTIFQLGSIGWSPTIEMTVHFRQRPEPGWCTATLSSRAVIDGMFEEDGLLWDESGALIAMSRQLAAAAS